MTLPFSTLPASFRGVPFLVPSGDLKEGRNTILHQYPDSNRRYGEDNGGFLPCFKVEAVVHGRDAQGKMQALRSALMRPGGGTLRHPYFGVQRVAVDGEYTVSHKDSEFGIISFDIPFAVIDDGPATASFSGLGSVVTSLAAEAGAAMIGSIVERWLPR